MQTKAKDDLEKSLRAALKLLERATMDLAKTQRYGQESEKLKMLQELIKEQVGNENSSHPTR